MPRKDPHATDQGFLIDKSDQAVSNYIIDQATDHHLYLNNYELNAILLFLEGWSQITYNKYLCRYGSYFKFGKYGCVLPSTFNLLSKRYGSGSITGKIAYYSFTNKKLKQYIPTVKYVNVIGSFNLDQNQAVDGKGIFTDFTNRVLYLLFYQHVNSSIVLPELKNQNKTAYYATVSLPDLKSVDKDFIKDIYHKYWSKIEDAGIKSVREYRSSIDDRFPIELYSTKDGKEIYEQFSNLILKSGTISDTDKNNLIELIRKVYDIGKSVGKDKKIDLWAGK